MFFKAVPVPGLVLFKSLLPPTLSLAFWAAAEAESAAESAADLASA